MLAVRIAVAAALVVSGLVHLDLASSFDAIGDTVTVGALFRVQGAVALAVAGWLLLQRRSLAPVLAALAVGLASALAVVLSVYVRVPALGPFPELYEPVWYAEKWASAASAGLAAVGAAVLAGRRRTRSVP